MKTKTKRKQPLMRPALTGAYVPSDSKLAGLDVLCTMTRDEYYRARGR